MGIFVVYISEVLVKSKAMLTSNGLHVFICVLFLFDFANSFEDLLSRTALN